MVTYRQVTLVVKTPPSKGPATEAMPNTAPIMPMYIGRLFSGAAYIMRIMAPLNKPPAPSPATARPQMKPTELGAAPQTAEPISKTTTRLMKIHLGE